jgi:hypothetical protein
MKTAEAWAKSQKGALHFEVVASEFAKGAQNRGNAVEAQRWLDAIAAQQVAK